MNSTAVDSVENGLSQQFSQLSSDEQHYPVVIKQEDSDNLGFPSSNNLSPEARRYLVSSSQHNLPEIEFLSQELRVPSNNHCEKERQAIDKIKQEIEDYAGRETQLEELKPAAHFIHKPVPQYYSEPSANYAMPQPMMSVSWGSSMHNSTANPSCTSFQSAGSILNAATSMVSIEEQNYEHKYQPDCNEFRVFVVHEQKNSLNWNFVSGVTSDKSRVLYCKKDLLVPFHIYCPPSLNNGDVQLEIRVEFSEESARNKVIQRCPNHRTDDASPLRTFFMRHTTNDGRAQYKDSIGNVIVMPLAREGPSSIDLSFTCFTSCPTLAKYPIRVVFSLHRMHRMEVEYPLAESWFSLKVCANPARDVENARDGITCDDRLYNTLLHAKATRPRAKKRRFSLPHLEEEHCGPSGQMSLSRGMPSALSTAGYPEHLVDITVRQSDALKILPSLTKQAIRDRNALLRREESGGTPSPFRGIDTLTRNTTILGWLSLPSLELAQYAERFVSRNIRTLGELMTVYNSKLFGELGIPQPVRDQLNAFYLNWAYGVQCTELEFRSASTTGLN